MTEKIETKSYGFKIIKKTDKDHPGQVLMEIWQGVGDSNKPISNSWKLISSEWLKEPEYKKPIWVDSWEEYWALKKLDKDANVHMKSKPTSGPYFIGPKGDICFRMTDEYDHMYTIRIDNPNNLNAEEATELMRNINGDCKKGIDEDVN